MGKRLPKGKMECWIVRWWNGRIKNRLFIDHRKNQKTTKGRIVLIRPITNHQTPHDYESNVQHTRQRKSKSLSSMGERPTRWRVYKIRPSVVVAPSNQKRWTQSKVDVSIPWWIRILTKPNTTRLWKSNTTHLKTLDIQLYWWRCSSSVHSQYYPFTNCCRFF